MTLDEVQVGDTVFRSFVAGDPIRVTVTAVDDHFIYVGTVPDGWKFDRTTGAEVDGELGWGPDFGGTGSFIVPVEP